ncbi:MAG: type II toxin-antitoxin system VapC family toxin [Nitrospinae bacterium]|nr:type II toxin-antitoxin system VapC family toxin [Nitrospinota bacterium]
MIVLDTHVWFWWVNLEHDRLPSTFLSALNTSERAGVASVSCFEIALAAKRGRLELPVPPGQWFNEALEKSGIEIFHLSPSIAERAVNLAEISKDPFDRIIIATALEHDASLLSLDSAFPRYPELVNRLVR